MTQIKYWKQICFDSCKINGLALAIVTGKVTINYCGCYCINRQKTLYRQLAGHYGELIVGDIYKKVDLVDLGQKLNSKVKALEIQFMFQYF